MKCLITPAKVIDLAFSSSDQIEESAIKETKIDAAQESFLRPVLGDKLFNALLEGKYTDFLAEYLFPALAYYVRYAIIPDIAFKLDNCGVNAYTPMHSNSATDKQRTEMRQQAKEDANALLDKAIRYIESHREEFTEYQTVGNVRKRVLSNGGIILV